MVTGTKFSKKIFFAIFANWVILNRKIQKKIFSSINPPPPPLASRTKFSEKFYETSGHAPDFNVEANFVFLVFFYSPW